ncbi:MAG: hypothetical protein ACI3XI_07940 [Eubacteriales bacterium]
MKKLITIVLTLSMIAALFVLPSSAAAMITEAEASAWKYTLLMQSFKGDCYSGAESLVGNTYTMRGMAVSQDGKYLYGGFLHPNGSGGIGMFDAATGKILTGVQYDQGDGKYSFPKGLATDDRGYLYAALAWEPNYGKALLGIYEYADNQLTLKKDLQFVTTDDGTKTGVNGITVEKINGSYFAYVVVNYKVDYLYRINVTDINNPVVDTSFGTDGRIELADPQFGSGNVDKVEAQYLDVDTDGTIYVVIHDSPVKRLVAFSADGKSILKTIEISEGNPISAALYGDYLFVAFRSGQINIYNKNTFESITSVTITTDNIIVPHESDDTMANVGVTNVYNIMVVGDILFIGDQGGSSFMDQIFAVGLTADAEAIVSGYAQGIRDRLTSIYPDETTGDNTTEEATSGDDTTQAATEGDDTTEAAPAGDDTTATPVETADNTTADTSDDDGCGSLIAGGAVLLTLIAAAVVLKKKD